MSHIIAFGSTVLMTAKKDIKIASKYLPNFISVFIQIALRIFFFILMANALTYEGSVSLSGKTLFVFFASSFLIWFFTSDALYGSLHAINNDLYNGTLEYIYYLPIQRYAYFLGTVMAKIAINVLFFLPTLVFLAIYNAIPFVSCLHIVGVCALVCLALTNLGIWLSSLGLMWKQVGAVIGILTQLFDFLAGAFIPVSEFPGVIKYCAYILPHTWGYDLIRYYAIGDTWATLQPLPICYLAIVALAIFFFVMSLISMRHAERVCLKQGFSII